MRKAISLIELVFSIVIIGIVALSFPMILSQTNNNMVFALQQEALLSSKTYIGTVLSYDWDANTRADADFDGKAAILDTTGSATSDPNFDVVVATGTRSGIIEGEGRRVLSNLPPLNNGGANTIEGYNNNINNINIINPNSLDMKLSFNLVSSVFFVSDVTNYAGDTVTFNFDINNAGGITNIKTIQTTATNAQTGINIVLRAFASNIGEVELLERSTW